MQGRGRARVYKEFIKPKDIKDNSDKVQLSFHKMLEYVQRKELDEKEYGNQILLESLKAKQKTKNNTTPADV